MGCLSGCLMYSASIQKLFCGIFSVFKWSFNDFVGEKVVSPSYSSAILGPPPLGWVFLKLILPSIVATWEPGIPGSGCIFPGRLRCDSLLEIKSPGRLRHDDLLGFLDWRIPKQVEAWQPSEDQIPRQVKAGWPPGTPRLELGVPKISSVTSAG